MQEKLLNDHVIKVEQCIEDVLLNYNSNSLFLLDKYIGFNVEDYKQPSILLPLAYIYYMLLNDVEKKFFKNIHSFIINESYNLIKDHINFNMAKDFIKNNIDDMVIEDKILYYFTLQVFGEYANKKELFSLCEPFNSEKFESFLEVAYSSNFSKFNDVNIFALLMYAGYRKHNIFSFEISNFSYDILEIILYHQISNILLNKNEENENKNIEQQFFDNADILNLK